MEAANKVVTTADERLTGSRAGKKEEIWSEVLFNLDRDELCRKL